MVELKFSHRQDEFVEFEFRVPNVRRTISLAFAKRTGVGESQIHNSFLRASPDDARKGLAFPDAAYKDFEAMPLAVGGAAAKS